jgi:RimJ/RimL family protein N-acetyltransferase
MEPWIKTPLKLIGSNCALLSLKKEHIDILSIVAKQKSIWEFYAIDGSDDQKLISSLNESMQRREQGLEFPFVIRDRKLNTLIGSTRYLELQPHHRKLEIGWTWLHPDYWGTSFNTECKLLLLTYCFETLRAVRVQLKTDEKNIRSRKAIQKIGGKLEGVFRNDMIRDNNTKRNSLYFSIIEEEWPEVKRNLIALLSEQAVRHHSGKDST